MWVVRFRIRMARPRARGCQRFMVTPSSAVAVAMTRSSAARPWFDSAFDTAERSTSSMSRETARGENVRIAVASATRLPRIFSSTTRALRADERTALAWARTRPVSS